MIPRRRSDGRAARGRLARRITAAAVGGRGSRTPSVATAGTGGLAQRRTARRGLAIYFAVLVPSSVAMYAVAIPYGIGWAAVGMFISAVASTVARFVLHEPFPLDRIPPPRPPHMVGVGLARRAAASAQAKNAGALRVLLIRVGSLDVNSEGAHAPRAPAGPR